MKKLYETPTVEKIAFRYRDQVVAASGSPVANSDTGVGNSAVTGPIRWLTTS